MWVCALDDVGKDDADVNWSWVPSHIHCREGSANQAHGNRNGAQSVEGYMAWGRQIDMQREEVASNVFAHFGTPIRAIFSGYVRAYMG